MGKELSFRPKKWVFGVFTPCCTKSLRNFTVVLRWCSNLQDGRLFNWARCATNKMDNFIRRKKSSGPKNFKKMFFFWVFTHYCTKTLRNFTAVLRWCSNLLDGRLFDWASCATNKMDNFIRRKKVLGQKTSKKWVFWVFTHYCTKSLRTFTVVLRWCSNFQDSRLFNRARCASNKMDNFIRRKKSSGPKNFKKMGFSGFSHFTALNRFSILL